MIQKEMKYNLHHGEVRGDVLWPPYSTKHQQQCSKINVKKDCLLKQRTHYRLENGSLGFIVTLHKQ